MLDFLKSNKSWTSEFNFCLVFKKLDLSRTLKVQLLVVLKSNKSWTSEFNFCLIFLKVKQKLNHGVQLLLDFFKSQTKVELRYSPLLLLAGFACFTRAFTRAFYACFFCLLYCSTCCVLRVHRIQQGAWLMRIQCWLPSNSSWDDAGL